MKLGWLHISAVVSFLAVLSHPLCALDFEREIAKQNAKGKSSSQQIHQRAINPSPAPRIADRSSSSSDFQVQLTTIKR